ncbi:MAG TPA: 2-C-methyl-D-erythritol 4-phosphate cytidylyltransferase [Tepidisphaeraceae bacterium]|jgi:2-C-methyl-D-erythritol 4-phosphate cytidylyltransferase
MAKVAAILVTANPNHTAPDDAAMTKIDGRESALRAIELMTNRDPITQVLLAVDPADAEEIKRRIGSHLMFMGTKLAQAAGGWYAQLAAAEAKLADDITHVLVHDAARPSVPYTDLEALLAVDAPAAALALPVRGTLAKVTAVPGPGVVETIKVAVVLTPRLYDRATFATLCREMKEPPLQLIEASPLNVRCNEASPAMVKAMVGLLPKPKVVRSNPFEEAQW